MSARGDEFTGRPADFGFDALLYARPWRDASGAVTDLEITDLNGHATTMLRRPSAELVGSLLSHSFPEIRARGLLERYIHTALSGEETALSVRVTAPQYGMSWVRIRCTATTDGVVIAINDISSLVIEELAQHASEHRFRAAFLNAATGIALVGLDGRWLEVNDAIVTMLGYSREDLLGMTFQQVTHPDDLEMDLQVTQQLLRGELEQFTFQKRYLHRNGHVIWVELHVALLRESDGAPTNFISQILDITERKRIELEFRESQERLSLALEAADSGWWEYDVAHDVHRWSDNFARLVGYEPDTYPGTIEAFLERVHPDDRTAIATMNVEFDRWIEDFEYRIQLPNGTTRWMNSRSKVIRHADTGAVQRIIGIDSDVTRRLHSEEESRAMKLRLELALECAQMGWWERDLTVEKHRWSDSFARLIGYEPDTYPGTVAGFLERVHPEDHDLIATMNADVTQWQETLEFRVQLPNGETRWLSANSKQILNPVTGATERIIGVNADITKRKLAEAELRQRATHDALTGLPNRRLFTDRLEGAISVARRSNGQLAVGFLDLDRFKVVNDSLGHTAGDALLQQVGARLQSIVRTDDFVARLGGDEFTFILPAVRSTENGVTVAEKILSVFTEAFPLDGHELMVNASIGFSLFPSDGTDAETLLRHADAAKRRAKQAGRGSFQFYRSDMTSAAQAQLELERDLRRALEGQQLELHYQPQYALSGGEVLGVEALLRWRHPTRGYIPPSVFIPIAEDTGLIVAIGDWVLDEACRQTALWQREAVGRFRVAVNVSALQFERQDLAQNVEAALRRHALDARWLELELTESLVMRDVSGSTRQLQRLRESGVAIAVDDFGTGYSSLAYLQRLPIDRLKIDRAFVKDLGAEHDTTPLVQAVVALAHTLGMEVVAEGIETTAQLETLRALRCEMGQGYLLGRPVPPVELLERLGEHAN